LRAMSTATGHGDRQAVKPAPSETQRDLYDPHFPARKQGKEAPSHVRNEIFDPHFPSRVRQ
jgi:hypothetical protein